MTSNMKEDRYIIDLGDKRVRVFTYYIIEDKENKK